MNQNEVLNPQPGIKRYFYVQRFCFARIGINVNSLHRTIISPLKFWFLTLSLVLYCFPILLYAIQNIRDLYKATDSLSPIWETIIVIFKAVYFKCNSKKIIMVIQKLWLWNLEAKDEEHAILASENRKDILFCTFYHFAVASTAVAALVAPIAVAGFYVLNGEKFFEYLEAPARAAYYIDKQSIFGYFIVYIWNVIACYAITYGSVSIDSLFCWLMCNIVAHFRILKYRLRQAGEENNGNCSVRTISDCIAYHSRTLELVKDFNNSFRVIVFIIFGIKCIQLCCLAFQLCRDVELFNQLFHGVYLIAISMQLILYCYGGQRIENESESIANEVYDSFHWESLTISNKKILILVMKRSQESCNVSGIFFTANLSLFLWVYRTAASFITLLGTLEEKENEMQ